MNAPLTVLSPEQVAIQLQPAGLGRRVAAALLDLGIVSAVTSMLTMAVQALLPEAVGVLVRITGSFVLFWGYAVFYEQRHQGQTIGKRLLRLRVTDVRGLPVSLSQSLVRNVVRVLDLIPAGGIGLLTALLHPHGRRLGDLAADTVVVEERQPPTPDLSLLTPLRVNSLDTPRLRRLVRHRLPLAERELLLALCLRAEVLAPAVRFALFEEAAARYRARFAIPDAHLSGENLVRGLVALCYQRPGG